jgi:hypothetical protein
MLLYVNNMVLLNTDARKLVEMLKVVDLWMFRMAMRINATKTKIMFVATLLLEEWEDDTLTPEMGTWESAKTFKTSELNCTCQNTLH